MMTRDRLDGTSFSSTAQRDDLLTGLFGLIWIHKHFGNSFQFPIPDFHVVFKKIPNW